MCVCVCVCVCLILTLALGALACGGDPAVGRRARENESRVLLMVVTTSALRELALRALEIALDRAFEVQRIREVQQSAIGGCCRLCGCCRRTVRAGRRQRWGECAGSSALSFPA